MDETRSDRNPPADTPDLSYQWMIFGILSFSHFLMAMFFFGWGPLAPMLKGELGIHNSQLGFIVSAMYFAMMFVSVPSGFLVDKYGARIMLMLSVSLVGTATFVLSVSSSYTILFLVAALGGAGYGMINQITTKGLMYWFEPNKRATIMGIKQTGVTVGGGLVGLYIPLSGQIMGWQRAMLVLAIAILCMPLFSLFFYREKPDFLSNPLDDTRKSNREKGGLRLLLLRPGVVTLTLLFASYAACQSCVVAFLVVYTEEAFDLSRVTGGSFLTVAMVAGTITRIIFGLVSDRLLQGNRLLPMALLAFIGCVGIYALTLLGDSPPLWFLYVISVLLGTSLVGWNGLAITLVAEIAGYDLVGSIMGIVFTISWGGMVIAPPVFGAMVDWKGYDAAWLMLTGLIGIASLGFLGVWIRQRKTGAA
jgi:sugar phosphate permease